jgi:signal transduction histidine kinase
MKRVLTDPEMAPESLDALRAELEERLRFETFLAETSARFVHLPPDRIESEIVDAQRQVCEFLDLDRSALWLLSDLEPRTLRLKHLNQPGGGPPVPKGVDASDLFPWTEKRIMSGQMVAVQKLSELPQEAGRDRESYTLFGTKSTVVFPFSVGGGPVFGGMSFAVIREERAWPESVLKGFQLIAQVFSNALERKQARLEIQERLRFEKLISDLSAGFVYVAFDQIGREIQKGIRSMAEFFDADRCSIGLFSEDRTRLTLAFDHHAAGTGPGPGSISKDQMPWYLEQLIQGKPVVVNRLEDLPPEAECERRVCRGLGMKSFLSIPLVSGGMTQGSCALVATRRERTWPNGFIPRLRLLGDILVNAMARKGAEEASRESERILRQNEHDLRRLAGRLIDAHEEERSRIARELHDDLAQRLAVLAIDVGALEKRWVDPAGPVKEELREIKKGIVGLSQDVHSLSRQLHPSILDDLGLIKAVESECAGVSKREGLEVVFRHESMPRVIPQDVSLHLYRIVQEGLRNISKHACAEHASVSLRGLDRDVLLSIEDDGIGFDGAEARERPGLGFLSMRERARLIHGDLAIQSRPERGTVITLRAPLAGRENG